MQAITLKSGVAQIKLLADLLILLHRVGQLDTTNVWGLWRLWPGSWELFNVSEHTAPWSCVWQGGNIHTHAVPFCPRMCRSPVFDATLCWWVEGHCKASVAGGLVEVRVLWEQESVGWLGERGSVVKGSGWGIYVEVTDEDMTGKEWWVSCIRACSEKWQRFWRFYEFSTGMLGYFFCLSMILQLSFM